MTAYEDDLIKESKRPSIIELYVKDQEIERLKTLVESAYWEGYEDSWQEPKRDWEDSLSKKELEK